MAHFASGDDEAWRWLEPAPPCVPQIQLILRVTPMMSAKSEEIRAGTDKARLFRSFLSSESDGPGRRKLIDKSFSDNLLQRRHFRN